MKKTMTVLGTAALLILAALLGLLLMNRQGRGEGVSPAESTAVESSRGEEKSPGRSSTKQTQEAEIRLLGDEELVLEVGQVFSDPGAEAWLLKKDGSRGEALEVSVSSAPDTEQLGTTEITYSAVSGGETLATVIRRVIVRDTQAPVITLLSEPGDWDFTAQDNVDGDISDHVQKTEEEDRIIYTVRDSSGNEAQVVRMLAPTLILAGGESLQIPADYRFLDPGFTARDAYGHDLSERVTVEGHVTPWRPGSYVLSYSLTDDEGRRAEATRTVEVVKAEMPETVLQEKTIYLTFDDGPAGPTEELLDMLAKYPDVKVTFFVTNTDPRYVDLIGREYREGHSIGLHAYAHDASKIYTSEEDYFYYFDKMEELIYQQTGTYTRIVRFVGGSSNTSSAYFSTGIMTRLAEDLTNMGYRYYDWNMQPENAECNATVSIAHIKGTAEYIFNQGTSVPISLQHDTAGWNIAVVEAVIQWGLANGYSFKGIDLTTPEWHHNIRN